VDIHILKGLVGQKTKTLIMCMKFDHDYCKKQNVFSLLRNLDHWSLACVH